MKLVVGVGMLVDMEEVRGDTEVGHSYPCLNSCKYALFVLCLYGLDFQ